MKHILFMAGLSLLLTGCADKVSYDATGTFETDEIIVSAEQSGKILTLGIREGDSLAAGQQVGAIDVSNLRLQKEQKEAAAEAIAQRTIDAGPQLELVRRQLAVQESQLAQQERERSRTASLVKADAATQKQLDDISAAIDQLKKSIAATRQQISLYESSISTQNRSILSERAPALRSVSVVADQIQKGSIINPVSGTVLTQYAFAGEYAAAGKPLYKVGDLSVLTLRAYITGSQLPQVRLGQQVEVLTDDGRGGYRAYPGRITWISGKAEFTPKTIQTKDERADLVYAIRIRVANDGFLKLGMYAEIKF